MSKALVQAERDGQIVRQLRLEHGLSQECVGMLAGKSRSWTNQTEQGAMRPDPAALARLGRKVDARFTLQAARRVFGGAFVGPVLDGGAVDMHRAAVAAKTVEEIEEALESARRLLSILLKPLSARSQAERAEIPHLRLQMIDAERAVEQVMVALANEANEDVAAYYAEHDRKLVEKGYTRESAPVGTNGRSL